MSPIVNLGKNNMMLSFKYKNSMFSTFHVYISKDGGKTYKDNIEFVCKNKQTLWANIEIDLKKYAGEKNIKIVFLAKNTQYSSQGEVCIDNIQIRTATKCKRPIGFYTTNLSTTNATINWGLSNIGETPTEYQVLVEDQNGKKIFSKTKYKPIGYVLPLTDLNANTTYNVKLKPKYKKMKNSDREWSKTFSFSTICDSQGLPISKNFNADTNNCWYISGSNAENSIIVNNIGNSGIDNKSIKIIGSDAKDACIASPIINEKANNLEITFKVFGKRYDKFIVALSTDPSDITFGELVEEIEITSSEKWTEYTIETSSFYSDESGFAVMFYTNIDKDKILYFDDITITTIPKHQRPKALTALDITETSADIMWTDSAQYKNYELRLFGAQNERIINIDSTSIKVAELAANTEYECSVRSIAPDGSKTAWSNAISFHTQNKPLMQFPFVEDFEGDVFPPALWSTTQTEYGINEGEGYPFGAWAKETDNVYQGTRCAQARESKKYSKSILVSPQLYIDSANVYELSFNMFRSNTKSHFESLRVYVNNMPNTTNATLITQIGNHIEHHPAVSSEGWYKYSCLLPNTGKVFIIFENLTEDGHSKFFIDAHTGGHHGCAGDAQRPIFIDQIEINRNY